MNTPTAIAEKYVAQWNEPDAQRRHADIAELWTEDAVHRTPSMEMRGHAAMALRISTAYEKWVRDGGCQFVLTGAVSAHHDAVRLQWTMQRRDDGAVLSVGTDFLLLDEHGQIRLDYQFIDANG